LVGRPDSEDDEKDEAGQIDGAASAQAGVAADEDHGDVGQPHGEGQQDFGIEKVRRTDGLLGDDGADEQAGGHAGEAEEESLEGDLIGGFERRKPLERRGFSLETALLNEIEKGSEQREKERCVGCEQEGYVEEDPAGVQVREGGCLFAGTEGGDEAEEEADGKDEDSERDGLVASVDEEEGEGEDKAEKGLGLVGVDGETVVGGVEHLDERDEVEEECGGGGGDGDVAPAGTVVQRRRKDGERGNTVEENRDSEPEEGHGCDSFALLRILSISGCVG